MSYLTRVLLPPSPIEERITEARDWTPPEPVEEDYQRHRELMDRLRKSKDSTIALAATAFDLAESAHNVLYAHKQRLVELYGEIDRLRNEIAELRSGAVRATLVDADRGKWEPGAYRRGDMVTLHGSSWIAKEDTDVQPGTSPVWRLIAQAGRDGRDRR